MLRTLRVLALGRVSPAAAEEREAAAAAMPAVLRRGYGLIEIILGIAIIAAFVVRIFQSYTQADTANRHQDFMQMLGLINATIRSNSINAPNFEGVSEATVINALPRKYLLGSGASTAIRSVYARNVAVAPIDINGTLDGFTISTDVPRGDCVKTVLADPGRGLVRISVGGTASTDDERVTQAQAVTMCGSGAATDLLPFVWTMQ